MLFNSLPFIFGFLPPALAGFWLLCKREGARLWFLLAASLMFYSYWDWRFAPLLLGSILVNWAAISVFHATGRRAVLVAAIGANLLCLGVFKYLGFFTGIVEDVAGAHFSLMRMALPLGISFFTFHHIIYLVDLMKGRAPRYRFRDYALYIAVFPQILAGPLVRHNEIIPQFALPPLREDWDARLCRGIALFLIGLMKKIFLADALATQSDPVFAKAALGPITIGEAWTAALSFPLQIYFDFSGYSDMAIGLALLLGFALPFNFNAPYRATSVRDFWRRWHMTLMRFLRDYLYVPLGGNRASILRHAANLLITFTLAGLWHGAGWTFVLWGALQGFAIAAEAVWRRLRLPAAPAALGWALTLAFILVTWIFFRAPSLGAAARMLQAMAGHASASAIAGLQTVVIGAAVAMLGPTSQHFVEKLEPRAWLAPAAAVATLLALLKLSDGPSYEFIYFHF